MQMTASGLVTAGLFFFLSQAKPLAQLAPARPPSSVFAASISVSIVGQFVIHLASLLATLRLCQQYISPDDSTLAMDGKFQPNVINSAMFLLSVAMQINNFVVNYRGHPFTQSIQDNYLLWRSVQAIYLALLVLAGGQFEPLNDLLQMAPFPSANFQGYLLLILLANFSLSYTVEILSRRLE
jgi:cation-transporting ATPase 13A1